MARFNEMVALEASVKMSTAHYCSLAGWTKHEAESRAERLRFKMDGDFESYDQFLNNVPKHRSHSSEKLVLHAQFVGQGTQVLTTGLIAAEMKTTSMIEMT